MPTYKLTYFGLRGRGNPIRLTFKDNDVPYEEDTVAFADWPKIKPTMQFGQIPCLTVDGNFQLVQSNAILRYLGRELRLYGKNNKEAALIDMVNDSVEDMKAKYLKMIYTNYEAGKADYIKNCVADIERMETLLASNNGGQGFIVGDKISFADYYLFETLDVLQILSPGILDAFPLLKAYHQRMASRPKIAAFMASDYFKSLKVNGNGKQ